MKYLCLVYGDETAMRTVPDRECAAWGRTLQKQGHYVAAEALQPSTTARTVRVRSGRSLVTDGPFTEAKEHIAGFYLIEAQDMDEAMALASQIPPARVGGIEVRPIRDLQE